MEIVIVGCGPAGLMCAARCSENKKNKVTIIDSNEKAGKKLYITGKGRCNVTNFSLGDDFLKNVVNNQKFLYSSINTFSPEDCINFFSQNGTLLKIERGNRVFPQTDKASDITKTFLRILLKNNVNIIYNNKVKAITKKGERFLTVCEKGKLESDAVVIATGGKSYSTTGSTGDGYLFAKIFGHNIIEPKPALVPIILRNFNSELAGLSLKNITCSIKIKDKIYSQFGEMLFTHNGVSGPSVLSLSSFVARLNIAGEKFHIDLKPSLSNKQLDDRLIRDISTFKAKEIKNYLKELMPQSLIAEFVKRLEISGEEKVCDITKDMRKSIVALLKDFSFEIESLHNFDNAIITSGGVSVKEINPKTMESKLIQNLFFAGEVLDVDALTGGFNIQIALSTGFLAGCCLYGKGE